MGSGLRRRVQVSCWNTLPGKPCAAPMLGLRGAGMPIAGARRLRHRSTAAMSSLLPSLDRRPTPVTHRGGRSAPSRIATRR
jgi:hypothetical protein